MLYYLLPLPSLFPQPPPPKLFKEQSSIVSRLCKCQRFAGKPVPPQAVLEYGGVP